MNLLKTVTDIKNLKIQGAENIALSATKTINEIVETSNKKGLAKDLLKARSLLFGARPTEPCMRNSLSYLFYNLNLENKNLDSIWLKRELNQRIFYVLKHFEESKAKITEIGLRKIKQNMVIFTHCHSSTVVSILKTARKKTKFTVHVTETRPLLQGRITAKELLNSSIPVTMYVDSAARLALKKADLMMIGCDAITSEGKVINKIGSELFAEAAARIGVPVYVCTDSWKFDPKTLFGFGEVIETREGKEVWEKPPSKLKIDNHAFEIIDPNLISGVISELGIYGPRTFVEVVQKNYPWMSRLFF